MERRDAIYENLRDLKFEHRAGKFGEHDYEETKVTLENEAALVLAEIEHVTEQPFAGGAERVGGSAGKIELMKRYILRFIAIIFAAR